MDKEVKNTVIQVGIVYGAYVLLIKPMLPTFGASPEEEAAINSVDMASATDNPFSFQYAPMVDYFNKVKASGQTGGMAMPEYIKYFKEQWDNTDPIPPMDGTHGIIDAITGAEAIKAGFAWYKIHITGNTSDVLSVFNVVQSKSQVASIAAVLWYLYNIDLWTYLKEGSALMWRGLSSSDLKYVVDKVNSLPVTI